MYFCSKQFILSATKYFNSKLYLLRNILYIEEWLTDQNFLLIMIEERINLTLVINDKSIYSDIQLNLDIECMLKAMHVYHLQKVWVKILTANFNKNFLYKKVSK